MYKNITMTCKEKENDMNTLLIFFALPIATTILAIVLQKVLKCPLLVAGTFFAIFLIVTFAVFDASFLVFAILYTILAYITAVLTKLICRLIDEFCNHNHSTIRNMQDRPITINNTSPCTSINLANEANLLASSNGTGRNNNNGNENSNCNCNWCCRRR